MNRRHFLGALTVASAGLFVPRFGRWYRQGTGEPHLWGDGVHDDTYAIQWRLDRAAKAGAVCWLPQGTYQLTSGLVVATSLNCQGSIFRAARHFPQAQSMLTINVPTSQWRGNFTHNHIVREYRV